MNRSFARREKKHTHTHTRRPDIHIMQTYSEKTSQFCPLLFAIFVAMTKKKIIKLIAMDMAHHVRIFNDNLLKIWSQTIQIDVFARKNVAIIFMRVEKGSIVWRIKNPK